MAVEQTFEKYGAIHAVLASAGIFKNTPLNGLTGDLDIAAVKEQFDVNFFGALYTAKHASKYIA